LPLSCIECLPGGALVRRKRRVGGDEAQCVEFNVELLRSDLQKRGFDALTQFGFPGEDSYLTV
jgi:hypothetical protein